MAGVMYSINMARFSIPTSPDIFPGTLHKILGFGILADFLVSFFSEIPSLLMGPDWKPNFGDTPNESRLET